MNIIFLPQEYCNEFLTSELLPVRNHPRFINNISSIRFTQFPNILILKSVVLHEHLETAREQISKSIIV